LFLVQILYLYGIFRGIQGPSERMIAALPFTVDTIRCIKHHIAQLLNSVCFDFSIWEPFERR
jgi:hypothetical protein